MQEKVPTQNEIVGAGIVAVESVTPAQPTTIAAGSERVSRPVQSGLSVLARGESFVWLSGGMLIVAVLMIVSLLSFIAYRGMATFWPDPVAIFPMRQATLIAGEPQSTEQFAYAADQLGSLSDAARQAALERLASDPAANAGRTYLRVGNFDLSGKHFDYLNEFEQTSSEPFFPSQVWTVERMESGRFYGFPSTLTEQYNPASQAEYQQLQTASDLLGTLLGYADEATDDSVFENATEQLQTAQQNVALEYFERVVNNTTLQEGETWQFKNASDEWSSATIDDPTTAPTRASIEQAKPAAIRILASTPESIWPAYKLAAASVTGLRNQLARLQQELATNDEELQTSKLTLRQAELDYDVSIVDRVGELKNDWVTIAVAQMQLNDNAQTLDNITALDLPEQSKKIVRDAYAAMKLEYETQITQMQSDGAAAMATLDELPKECLEIVAAYRRTLEQITQKQAKVNERMFAIEEEVLAAQISFLSTTADSPELLPIDPSNSKPTDQLSDVIKLAAAGRLAWDESKTSKIEAEKIADNGWWLTLQESQRFEVAYVSYADQEWQVTPLKRTELDVAEIVRAYHPNQLTLSGKLAVFASRWGEFVSSTPREAGMEGGFFPAIWGTIVMTMIMALMVVPFGVLAALYLREYASSSFMVGVLRIAINNLAGVPSVVYGVFGLAFFCYVVGGYIDGGPASAGIATLPPASWYVALAALAIVSIFAFTLGFLCSGSPMTLTPRKKLGRNIAGIAWALSVIGFILLIAKSPFFHGLYAANLPNPTFGKGGLIWASLTLALLTLPVVIVATEEALSAVPNSLREGSYACGAGKWQTIQRIVLPHARPGIMTGTILAMARGAGEVAPMMLVGALPMAIDLPLDGNFPFFHGSRSFMHLGFQIYALGFQGQNSEAAKPMVFTTTLLLILIVLLLNLVAIIVRARLRKKFQSVQF